VDDSKLIAVDRDLFLSFLSLSASAHYLAALRELLAHPRTDVESTALSSRLGLLQQLEHSANLLTHATGSLLLMRRQGFLRDQTLPMGSTIPLLRQPFKSTFWFGAMLQEVKAVAVTQAQGEATLLALHAWAKPPQPSRFRKYASRRQSL